VILVFGENEEQECQQWRERLKRRERFNVRGVDSSTKVWSQFCSVGGKSPSERRCNFPGVATFQRFKRLGSPRRPFAWRRWEDVTRYKPLNLIKSSRKNRLESNATQFDVNIQAPDFRYGDNASVKAQLPRLHVLFLTVYSFRLLGRGVTWQDSALKVLVKWDRRTQGRWARRVPHCTTGAEASLPLPAPLRPRKQGKSGKI